MQPLGAALLAAAAVGGSIAAVRPRGALRWVAPVMWWCAVVFLAQRFVALDLSLREVVAYSRADLPGWLRFAGLWAGPAGSLLLWFAMVSTAATIATRRTGGPIARIIAAANPVAVITLVLWANPFRPDTTVPVDGRGLTPVLEHPAMLVHPPLLYSAHAAVVAAACVALLPAGGSVRSARRLVAGAAALLVSSTLLGAWWAHDELGWGGWWAWDPVENTALAPLAALVASLHAGSALAARRWAVAAAALMIAGVAAARSGLAESVHAFAPSPWPALVLLVVAAALAGAVWRVAPLDGSDALDPPGASPDQARLSVSVTRVVGVAAAWVALVVVTGEIAAAWVGSRPRPGSIDGGLVGRLLVPVGVAVVVGIVVLGRPAWRRVGAALTHAGVLLFAVGVVASTGDRADLGLVDRGDTVEIGGSEVTVAPARVVEDRPDRQRVVVVVTVDGVAYRPELLRYPDLDRTRARPARRSDWRGETEVVVSYVDDDRTRVEVRRHPGLGQVWGGGVMTALGLVVVAGGQSSRPVRRRLAASNESKDDASDEGPDGGAGGEGGGDEGGRDGGVAVGVGVGPAVGGLDGGAVGTDGRDGDDGASGRRRREPIEPARSPRSVR